MLGNILALFGPDKRQRETLFSLKGRGVVKRLWFTGPHSENLKLFVYVDDAAEPVLKGNAFEIARAAERKLVSGHSIGRVSGWKERESVFADRF